MAEQRAIRTSPITFRNTPGVVVSRYELYLPNYYVNDFLKITTAISESRAATTSPTDRKQTRVVTRAHHVHSEDERDRGARIDRS